MAARGSGAEEGFPAYPGWRVVAACLALAVFSWAFGFYGQGVFLARLRELHGWSVAEISTATTGYYLLSAGLVAFVGDAVARLGSRLVLIVGVVCLGLATILLGRVVDLWQLYAVYAVMAVGWAGTSVAAITTTIGGWFEARRGLAISLALNGASLGGIVGVPALVAAIDRFGFAAALLYGGLVMVGVLVPLIAFLVPERTRWAPRQQGRPGDAGAARRPGAAGTRRHALRSGAFWTITGPFAFALFVQVGFIVHQFSLIEAAAGAGTASFAVGLTAVAAVVGRLALGTVIDRVDQRLASALSLLAQAVALGIIATATNGAILVAASGLFGLSVGNLITLPSVIVHREFRPEAFAVLVALSTAIGQFVYAFGPGALGWLRDVSGGYGLPLVLCVAIDLAAAAVLLRGGRAMPA